jgi:glyoxylase-like metal-dependent hydrolase (beta-lactamase superfamily II)
LAANPHWGERGAVRPPHATTTLIVAGKAKILVDPSLPAQALVPRLVERSGIGPDDITHVFLTCLNPAHRRRALAFERAQWLVSEREREAIGVQLIGSIKEAHGAGDDDLVKTLGQEIAVIERTVPAPDKLAAGVDLFPMPESPRESTGLLLPGAGATTLIAGDAVATVEHLAAGQVIIAVLRPRGCARSSRRRSRSPTGSSADATTSCRTRRGGSERPLAPPSARRRAMATRTRLAPLRARRVPDSASVGRASVVRCRALVPRGDRRIILSHAVRHARALRLAQPCRAEVRAITRRGRGCAGREALVRA